MLTKGFISDFRLTIASSQKALPRNDAAPVIQANLHVATRNDAAPVIQANPHVAAPHAILDQGYFGTEDD